MKDRTLILLLTGMCALLGMANIAFAVSFAQRGAWASVSTSVTAVEDEWNYEVNKDA